MKYLGLDWGLKKIGLALSEGFFASPFKILTVDSLEDAVSQIEKVVQAEEIDILVLGKPEGESGKLVEKAYQRMKKEGWNIVLADETLSTQEAQSVMIKMRLGKKERKEDNAVSAAIILQRWLDENIPTVNE